MKNRISIFDEIRNFWELPADLTVSQWADENRVLDPRSSAEPGQWSTARTPYLRGIMDAFNDAKVRSITIMASTQVGKTESMLNIFGYLVDQDPGPALWVNTTEELAKSFCKHRIHPMVIMSQALSKHLTGKEDDLGKLEIAFDRMPLFIAWSNSPAALSSRPIKYIFFDEVDKYPKFSGKEADPIKLGEERTSTFWNHKIIKCSTPTTKQGYIYNDYLKTDKCQYYVPCPHCGHYQVLNFHQIKWPKDEFTTQELKDKRLASYECFKCKEKMKDIHKNRMLQRGVWCPEACEVDKNGKIVGQLPVTTRRGFWINALYSPWLTFSDLAAEFLESKDQINDLMNFINSKLAEIWEESLGVKKPDQLRNLASHCAAGIVPSDAQVLLGAVDVQRDHFYLTIRAWGFRQKSWQVLSKRVESWEDVEHYMIDTEYPSEIESIGNLNVRLFAIDTGHRASEVYDFCRRHGDRARAIKGRRVLSGIPYSVSNIDKYPDGKPMPGGLKLYLLDTTFFKDKITRLVENTAPETPGGWYFHKNPTDDYLNQFCSEHKIIIRDKKGRPTEAWVPVGHHTPTHYWDCEVYAMAAAEMLHIFSMQPDQARHVYQPETGKSKWIPKKTGWIKHG